MRICKVAECGRKVVAWDLCSAHYQRWKSHGNLKASEPITKSRPGAKNHNWNGGKSFDRGRVMLYRPKHPRANRHGYVYRYTLVMEKHIGRFLKPGELVHHKDENHQNDKRSNLKLMASQAEHARLHAAKTTVAQVRRFKRLRAQKIPIREAAKLIGVPLRRAKSISCGETWKHICI
jgi:hypothetical protein